MNMFKMFTNFLMKNKVDASLEEYINYYNKKEIYYMAKSNGALLPLLEALYNTTEEEYKAYLKEFSKSDFRIVKRGVPALSSVINEKADPALIKEEIEMIKKEEAISGRVVGSFRNNCPDPSNYESHKQQLEEILELIKDEDNPIVNKCKEDFKEVYGNTDNKYLKECYELCLTFFQDNIKSGIEDMHKSASYLVDRYCKSKNFDDYVNAKLRAKRKD